MNELMVYTDFPLVDESQTGAKCFDCKRMHCSLRNIFDKINCQDCYQKQVNLSPEIFYKAKFNVNSQQNLEPSKSLKQDNNLIKEKFKDVSKSDKGQNAQKKNNQDASMIENKKPSDLKISPILLFGCVFLGIISSSGIILAIIFGLQIGGVL